MGQEEKLGTLVKTSVCPPPCFWLLGKKWAGDRVLAGLWLLLGLGLPAVTKLLGEVSQQEMLLRLAILCKGQLQGMA